MTSNQWAEFICRKKITYRTRKTAKKHAKHLLRKGLGKMKPYRCDICGAFHLTSVYKSGVWERRLRRERLVV